MTVHRFSWVHAVALVSAGVVASCSGGDIDAADPGARTLGSRQLALSDPAEDKDETKIGMPWIGTPFSAGVEPNAFEGSAVLLTNGWVLTAAHVLDKDRKSGPDIDFLPRAGVKLGKRWYTFTRNDVVFHPTWSRPYNPNDQSSLPPVDMALIRLPGAFVMGTSATKWKRKLSTASQVQGIQARLCASRNPDSSGQNGSRPRCRTNALNLAVVPGQPVLVYDVPSITQDGDSGGPLFEFAGAPEQANTPLLGIHVGVENGTPSARGWMVPVTQFRQFASTVIEPPAGETVVAMYQRDDDADQRYETYRIVRLANGSHALELIQSDGTLFPVKIPITLPSPSAGKPISNAWVTGLNQLIVAANDRLYSYGFDFATATPAVLVDQETDTGFVAGYTTDVDRDGTVDLVAIKRNGEKKVYFADPSNSFSGGLGIAFAEGDFDADGNTDYVWATDPAGTCSTSTNTGCVRLHYRLSTGTSSPSAGLVLGNTTVQAGSTVALATGNFRTVSWETSTLVGDEIVFSINGLLKTYASTNGRTSLPVYQSGRDINMGVSSTYVETIPGPSGTRFASVRIGRADGTSVIYDGTANGLVPNSGSVVPLATVPTDFVLVLDRSGSMSARDFKNDPSNRTRLQVAVEGASIVADVFGTGPDAPLRGHRVGVVSYGSEAEVLTEGLIDVADGFDPETGEIGAALAEYEAGGPRGSTSIGAGIGEAISLLGTGDSDVRARAILLMTDGRQNKAPCIGVPNSQGGLDVGQCPNNVATQISKTDPALANVKICSLGIARSAFNLDERVLEGFSGQYLEATSSGLDLASAAIDFAKCLDPLGFVPTGSDPTGVLLREQVAAPPSSYDSAGDSRLAFIASWSNPAQTRGDVRLLVNRPNGDLLVPSAARRALRAGHQVDRVDAPEPGKWRTQVVRATNRFVNGFTTDSVVDHARGVALVRRQIQRLCPDGCDKALYFEDGRAVPSNPSIYADALAAEVATGLVGVVQPFTQATGTGFATALGVKDYDLVVYAHQLADVSETYDEAITTTLCTTKTPAIVTDTRVAGEPSEDAPTAIHFCSGAAPAQGTATLNYQQLGARDGTLLDQSLALRNPGYAVSSYGVAAQPFDDQGLPDRGATQLEADDERLLVTSAGGVSFYYGSIVSLSADNSFFLPGEPRERKVQRWASQVHFEGYAPLRFAMSPTAQGAGMTLKIASSSFLPPSGITGATVTAQVVAPMLDASAVLAQRGCNEGGSSVGDDPVVGPGRSVSRDDIPVATTTHTLNDLGLQGDAVAGDRTWSLFVPSLGARQGSYRIRYFADFTFVDAQGVTRKMHREALATQYVGAEVFGAGEPCPSQCGPGVDVTPPTFNFVPPAVTVASCTNPAIGQATASDACGQVRVRSAAPATFPLGATTVTWYAEDAAGNVATATQVVTTLPGGAGCCPQNVDGRDFSAGGAHTCAILGESNAIYCWGANLSGQVGDGTAVDRPAPVRAGTLSSFLNVSAGLTHTCAVRSGGTAYCWGAGSNGQLGNGTLVDARSPTPVLGLPGPATSVSAGALHSCARLASGQVWCWGANLDGRLGNNSLLPSTLPVQVSGITNAVEVGAGVAHSCARLASGQVRCWGTGLSGRLGNNSLLNSAVPVTVSGLSDAALLTVGSEHSCAIRTNKSLVCWGFGFNGQLGNGGILDAPVPVPVASPLPAGLVADVEAGDDYTCATTTDKRAYCWGANLLGQLGDNTILGRLTPFFVSAAPGATFVTAGNAHTCTSGADGDLSCWGTNLFGQLGAPVFLGTGIPRNLCDP